MEDDKAKDFFFRHEIKTGLKRTKDLLESKILWEDMEVIYRQSVFIEVLVNLKDLLIKADKLGKRVSFNEDIVPDDRLKILNITDLISNFRDAACHSYSYRRRFGQNLTIAGAFSELETKSTLGIIDGKRIANDYDDDIVFIMGTNTLYLKRHIERAFAELEIILSPHAWKI